MTTETIEQVARILMDDRAIEAIQNEVAEEDKIAAAEREYARGLAQWKRDNKVRARPRPARRGRR